MMTTSRKTLSPELAEKARVELNEIQSEVPGQIQALREKITENPDFNFRTDDAFLLRFLRARKFDQEKTLDLITNYYKQRELYPHFFRKSASSGLEAALSSNLQGFLFNKDSDGRSVLVFTSTKQWDPSVFSYDDILTNVLLSLECIIEDEETQINGIVLLINCDGFSMKHLLNFSPMASKRGISILMHNFPINYKAIHYINEPYLFNTLCRLLRPFFNATILRRSMFHGSNLQSLHEQISPGIIPEEFGGHCGPYDNSAWNKVLIEHETVFRKNLQFGFVREK